MPRLSRRQLWALLAIVSTTYARGDTSPASGSVDQAPRLVEAKDYAGAMTVLEDLLIDANTLDKPAITGLLKQTYETLAPGSGGRTRPRCGSLPRQHCHPRGACQMPSSGEPCPEASRPDRHDAHLRRRPTQSRRARKRPGGQRDRPPGNPPIRTIA